MNQNNKKIKVVVLGAEGMLGNAIFKYLKINGIEATGTSRRENSEYHFFDAELFTEQSFGLLVEQIAPAYIINCIGYIRPNGEDASEYKKAIILNSIFPQNLSRACLKHKINLIHFSTDCIFSGKNGPYKDTDLSDEKSIYGVTKFLGEIHDLPNLTIRTSIIGRELGSTKNLLEWFLKTKEKEIIGYRNVYWNGISTVTAAKIIHRIINDDIKFDQPIIQIASEVISKYELLNLFKDIYQKNTIINESSEPESNKTLIPSKVQTEHFQDLILPLYDQVKEIKKFYE